MASPTKAGDNKSDSPFGPALRRIRFLFVHAMLVVMLKYLGIGAGVIVLLALGGWIGWIVYTMRDLTRRG
jgi:hypothetical protein